ncbi:MAG TPA: two-component regulator propeller domain-containing protein [Cyclobacteriaceae bacterium]|nr:two-component regulator propeller domain-containing protein [Cyclobacteriaceae bacterium]
MPRPFHQKAHAISRLALYFLVALGVYPQHSQCQQLIPKFSVLNSDVGLSQNSVYTIYQDRQGYMWFGTGDGLNRYDGRNIRVFKAGTGDHSANNNTIRGNICEDHIGGIWYTNETGIYSFDPATEQIRKWVDFKTDVVTYYTGIMIDHDQRFWMLNPTKGLVCFDPVTRQLTELLIPVTVAQPELIIRAEKSGDDILLFVTGLPGMIRFNTRQKKFDIVLKDLLLTTASAVPGGLLLWTGNKLWMYDSLTSQLTSVPIEPGAVIRSAIRDQDNRIWITTQGQGLMAYWTQSNKSVSFKHDPNIESSLPFNFATTMLLDRTGNLWIGTDGAGVAKLDLKASRFNRFPVPGETYPGLNEYFVRCLYEDPDGRIWFGTLNHGLCVYNPITGTVATFTVSGSKPSSKSSNNSVTSLLAMPDGNLLVGHSDGIFMLNKKSGILEPVLLATSYQARGEFRAYQMIREDNHTLICATSYGMVRLVLGPDGKYKATAPFPFAGAATSLAIRTDSVWITTRMFGLTLAHINQLADRHSSPLLARMNLLNIHQDELMDSILWISSGSGLIRFNQQTRQYKILNEAHGIKGNLVYGLIEDDQHNYWFSTNSGLCFMDRQTGNIRLFTVKDGLQSNEFNSNAFHKGQSGTLYFGGVNGFNWFRSGAELSRQPSPGAAVTAVLVNNVPAHNDSTFYISKQLTLPYHRNDLAFEMAVFDYSQPESNQVQYQLDGWEDQWFTSPFMLVRYHNLPPGTYTFRVRGSSGGNPWGPEASVRIVIEAPFWMTSWFYSAVGVIFLIIVIAVTRTNARRKIARKLQQLEKQKALLEERERISKDLHDDLGSGLSRIFILSEMTRKSGTRDQEFAQHQLEKISAASTELLTNLGNLVWSHNPANDSLLKLFAYMREHLGQLFDETPIALTITLPEPEADILVPATWRRNVYLSVKEALHNVLKHAHASVATLTVVITGNTLCITVQDNGVGFDAQAIIPGNGTGNMKKRIQDCGGTMEISSAPGKGARIQFDIPIPAAPDVAL